MNGNARADRAAAVLFGEYEAWCAAFAEVTRRAKRRFETRDWHGTQADAAERLAQYRRHVDAALACLGELLGDAVRERLAWARIRPVYAGLVDGRPDSELAETFFNSASRSVLGTVGADPDTEFIEFPASGPLVRTGPMVFDTYRGEDSSREPIERLLGACGWHVPYADAQGDAELVARAVDARLTELGWHGGPLAIDLLRAPFYRNKGAYLVGRIHGGSELVPLVLPLVQGDGGIMVDAVLLTQDEASVVFGFSWSYFFVDAPHPRGLIAFLESIMPNKRVDELYTSIGYNKHGKTELYRDLLRHLAASDDRFVFAPGEAGMVMMVFTLPSFDVVFKVIRDVFAYPKTAERREVLEKYRMVFRHGRAGRLVDVQEYEHLEFPVSRFAPDLLEKLLSEAPSTVRRAGESVVIHHVFTERRLRPLDLYLREAPPEEVRRAILDYGEAIRDLARTNIFPGDLLLKNFGLTRHGRVVFYDYDEIAFLTDVNIRELPESDDGGEGGEEPSFYVGENDVFPEELFTFMGLRGVAREAFLEAHRDLLGVRFWLAMQEQIRTGDLLDVFPYPARRRLPAPGD